MSVYNGGYLPRYFAAIHLHFGEHLLNIPRLSSQSEQPRPQGLLGVQNSGLEKTLANSRSRVSKNIGDFDCFKMVAGFMIG